MIKMLEEIGCLASAQGVADPRRHVAAQAGEERFGRSFRSPKASDDQLGTKHLGVTGDQTIGQ
jgi:hypothetical protein